MNKTRKATKTSEWKGIWVILEHAKGKVSGVSWEILGKARELGDRYGSKVSGVLLGVNLDDAAQEAIYRGADNVFVIEHEALMHYSWEAYTKTITDLVEEYHPNIMLLAATHNGRDLAGRLAVRLNTGLTADVVELDIDAKGELLVGSVPGFGGSILAIIKCEQSRPQMATIRPGVLIAREPDPSRTGEIHKINPEIPPDLITTQVLQEIPVETVDISKAKRIVAAGRGVGTNLELVEELAKLLDAAIGVTRPLADIGLKSRDHQIGSTGVTVRPKLAIIVGVSGAAHFVSGIQDAETIISINIDKDALIFDHSDYCVVADLNEVIPELIEALKARLYSTAK